MNPKPVAVPHEKGDDPYRESPYPELIFFLAKWVGIDNAGGYPRLKYHLNFSKYHLFADLYEAQSNQLTLKQFVHDLDS